MPLPELNRAIRGFIRETLGLQENSVRPANQIAPAGGTAPFVTVLLMSVEPTGNDDLRQRNAAFTNIEDSATGQRRIVASVQFFRGDAVTQAARLKTRLALTDSSEKLRALGLGFVSASTVRDLSAAIDAGWEARAQMDLTFHAIARETDLIQSYGTFPISVSTEASTTTTEVTES